MLQNSFERAVDEASKDILMQPWAAESRDALIDLLRTRRDPEQLDLLERLSTGASRFEAAGERSKVLLSSALAYAVKEDLGGAVDSASKAIWCTPWDTNALQSASDLSKVA